MSTFWKQSLWVGGIYWIISQVFTLMNTFEADMIDFAFSVLLTLFLVPMYFLVPVKAIDKMIKKMPVAATFLVSVGWVPYFIAMVFVISVVLTMVILMTGILTEDYMMYYLINILPIVVVVRQAMTILMVLVAAFAVLLHHKSIAGCLDKRYKLIADDSCNVPDVEPAVVEATKKAQKYKAEKAREKKKTTASRTVTKTKKVVAKKENKVTVKKETTKKKTVKKTAKVKE